MNCTSAAVTISLHANISTQTLAYIHWYTNGLSLSRVRRNIAIIAFTNLFVMLLDRPLACPYIECWLAPAGCRVHLLTGLFDNLKRQGRAPVSCAQMTG